MRRGFRNALVLLILLGMLPGALDKLAACTQWAPYTNQHGGYTVALPGKPMESTRTTQGVTGPVEVRLVATAAADHSGEYGVAYMDLPPDVRDPRDAAQRMEAMTHAFPGELLSKQTISVEGHPGREFTVRREKGVTTARVFIVRQRLYQLIVTSPEHKASVETRSRFLASFRLLAKR